MRVLGALMTMIVAAAAVVFAISNREVVAVHLWPLPYAVSLPVYLLVLGSVAFGLLAGGSIAWLSNAKYRRLAAKYQDEVAPYTVPGATRPPASPML